MQRNSCIFKLVFHPFVHAIKSLYVNYNKILFKLNMKREGFWDILYTFAMDLSVFHFKRRSSMTKVICYFFTAENSATIIDLTLTPNPCEYLVDGRCCSVHTNSNYSLTLKFVPGKHVHLKLNFIAIQ